MRASDRFIQSEEDRDTYLKRYLTEMQQNWSLLSQEEYAVVKDHIVSSDFPETLQTLQEIAAQSGLTRVECLYRDSHNTHTCFAFIQG